MLEMWVSNFGIKDKLQSCLATFSRDPDSIYLLRL